VVVVGEERLDLQANGGRGEMGAMGSSPAASALRSSSTGVSNCAARRGTMDRGGWQ
jgi:hypothetical protein